MKQKLLLIGLLMTGALSNAQVGIGTTNPNTSSALDITSTTAGLLIPRMTTAQKTAIATPATGLQVFDTTTNSLWFYNGTAWFEYSKSDLRVVGSGNHITQDAGAGYNGTSAGTGGNNIGIGAGTLAGANTAGQIIAIGYNALNKNTSGSQNTAIGTVALANNTTGGNNTAIGWGALAGNTTGGANMAMGYNALGANSIGNSNLAIGYNSLSTNTDGSNNVAYGQSALTLSTGSGNTAVGGSALSRNTSGVLNVAVGLSALGNTGGDGNVALGYAAVGGSGTYYGNVGVGYAALGNITNSGNVGVGQQALGVATSGANNTAIGHFAASAATTGSGNVSLGVNAGSNLVTGSNNLSVGQNTLLASSTGSNQMNIGNVLFGTDLTGSATSPAGNIGIGTTTPSEKLDVNGKTKTTTLQVTTGATAGHVLTSDAAGNATWTAASSIAASNIYNANGTLSGARTVTMAGNNLGFMGGNVGIGTTAPNSGLEVSNTGVTSSSITATNTTAGTTGVNYIRAVAGGVDTRIQNNGGSYGMVGTFSNNDLYLTANGITGALVVKPTGRIAIGTNTVPTIFANTPQVEVATTSNIGLHIKSSNADLDGLLYLEKSGATTTNDQFAFFYANGAAIGSITSPTTASIAYNTTSDVRLKENVHPTAYSLKDVMNIQVSDYNYKSDKDIPQTGFIAQQLYTIFPNAVTKGGDDAKKSPWMVDYSKVTPLLTKAIQEQQLEIESLKKANSELETRMEKLEKAFEALNAKK